MKFSKKPYKIATRPHKGRTPIMMDTVGMVLEDTGIAYRKQERGEYTIDHLQSGHYITTVQGSETLAKRICCELAKLMDFTKSKRELTTKDSKKIITEVITNLKGLKK